MEGKSQNYQKQPQPCLDSVTARNTAFYRFGWQTKLHRLAGWKDGYQIRIVQSQFKELVDSIGGKARDERDFPIEALEGEFSSREDGKVFVWHEAAQSPIYFKRENCHLPNHFTSSQLG